jgi:photosystem II stability/assembly factor-like uncharacterized protein
MKNLEQIWLAVLAAALITFLTNSIPASGQNAGQGQSSPPISAAATRNRPRDTTAGVKKFWAERTRATPVPANAYEKAKRQWDKLPKTGGARPGAKAMAPVSSLAGVVWRPLGPSPIQAGNSFWNGRANSIAINPYNSNEILLGASSGGVWRTNDGGNTWTPLIDHEPSLDIGEPQAIAIDPNNTNTVYVGSSNFTNSSNSTTGILKTTDGGGSWIVLGSGFPASNNGNALIFRGRDVWGVAVDPANSNQVYAASNIGLWTSTDGGNNWTHGTNGTGVAQSLVVDASSPAANRVLFAGIQGQGIDRSNDGGATWTQVLNSSTPAVAAALATHVAPPPAPAPGIGKVIVALAPPATPPNAAGVQVIYVTIEGTGGNFPIPNDPYYNILGIFQSTDQGATWTQRSATGLFPGGGACQCFYTNNLAVDPASPGDGANDILYWGGTNTFMSTDAGNTFSDVTNGIHADSHTFSFAPQPSAPSFVYAGNDGGIWRSINNGSTWTGTNGGSPPLTIQGGGLQTTLIYHMDVKRDATASVTLIALQDNGTAQFTGSPTWTNTAGGDGLIAVFDQTGVPANQSLAYAVNDGGPMKSTDSGSTWSDITSNLPNSGCNIQIATFTNSLDVDPSNAGYLYFGGHNNQPTGCPTLNPGQLFQTTDGGGSWRQITSLTFNSSAGPTAVAPANPNNVAVVANRGNNVFVSTNALASTVGPPSGVVFTDITRNLPGGGITQLAFDPNDPTVLYATLSGFGFSHILRTTIGGSSWTDLTPALFVPYNTIALDGASNPTGLYVGTDLGVLRSLDGGSTWATLDDIHLPNAPVTQLRINQQAGVLRASTYGRGVFDFAQATGPVISINQTNGLNFGSICGGSTSTQTFDVINTGNQNLLIYNVQNLFNSPGFSIVNNVGFPISISPDSSVTFTVQFTATAGQTSTADIRITSNDPSAPYVDLMATGNGDLTPSINATIANSGSFGNVCAGTQGGLTLEIMNQGQCNLNITSVSTSNPNFVVNSGTSYPLVLSPNANVDLPLTFTPPAYGTGSYVTCSNTLAQTANIFVASNDPNTPNLVQAVSGIEGCPKLVLSPTKLNGTYAFPATVSDPTGTLGCFTDRQITMSNAGNCPLTVLSGNLSASPSTYFGVVNPTTPLTISPGAAPVPITVRFRPLSTAGQNPFAPDQQLGSLSIVSNDPVAADDTAGGADGLCGEPTYHSGARVLVLNAAGAPINPVKSISLTSKGLTPKVSETLSPAPENAASVCGNTILYHLDNETLPPAGTTGSNPKASYVVTAKQGPTQASMSFTLGQCQMQQVVLQIK